MRYTSLTLSLLPVVLLAACPPGGQDSGTTSEPGGSSGSSASSGSSTSEDTPTSTGSTGPTSAGSSTTGENTSTTENATTDVDPGTTQPVDTTGVDTTGGDTTSDDTTVGDTTGTTADEGTSTGEPDDTQGLPDTTGGELCEAAPDPVDIEWSLVVPPALVGEALQADCKVFGSKVMGPEVAVTFQCVVRNVKHDVVLHYSLPPGEKLAWQNGQSVKLDHRREAGAWTNEWLKIVGGDIDFRGIHADALVPPGVAVVDFYGTSVGLDTPCDAQPDPCGQRQPLELEVYYEVMDVPVYSAIRSGESLSYGFPNVTRVWLEQATRLLEPIGCDDVAPLWIDMIFVDDSSNS